VKNERQAFSKALLASELHGKPHKPISEAAPALCNPDACLDDLTLKHTSFFSFFA
jgi:hypothetical protein